MAGMMPTLEKIAVIRLRVTTLLCTADVTQTIGGNSRTDSGAFIVNGKLTP